MEIQCVRISDINKPVFLTALSPGAIYKKTRFYFMLHMATQGVKIKPPRRKQLTGQNTNRLLELNNFQTKH